MIASGCPIFSTHTLLNHCPFLVFSNKERVMVELVACLNCSIVDFSTHFAGTAQVLDVIARKPKILSNSAYFFWRSSGCLALAPANSDTMLLRRDGLLQNSGHNRRHA